MSFFVIDSERMPGITVDTNIFPYFATDVWGWCCFNIALALYTIHASINSSESSRKLLSFWEPSARRWRGHGDEPQRNEAPFRVGKWHIFQSLRRATLQRTHIYIYIYPIVKTPKSPPNGRDKRKNPCEFLASLFVEKRGGYFNKHNLKENEKSLVSGGFLPTQCPWKLHVALLSDIALKPNSSQKAKSHFPENPICERCKLALGVYAHDLA